MGRANNTSRSLQIISKANGWDPTEIIGDAYWYNEDRVKVGDARTITSGVFDPNTEERNLTPPGPDTRGQDTNRTHNAPATEGKDIY